jgi:hypothetical protein
MNEWQALALICVLFPASWLLAYFTLRMLVDEVRKWLERRRQTKSGPQRSLSL